MNWEQEARNVVEVQMKFLNVFYSGLPEVTFKFEEEATDLSKSNGAGVVKPSMAGGKYSPGKKEITVYFGSIARRANYDLDSFILTTLLVVAHEHFHHYQMHGSRKEYYKESIKRDRENKVKYWDMEIEVEANEAAKWYVNRMKPIALRMA